MIRKTSSSNEILKNKFIEVILRSGIEKHCYYTFDKSSKLIQIGLMHTLSKTDIPKLNSRDYEKLQELGLIMNFYICKDDNCKVIELRTYEIQQKNIR